MHCSNRGLIILWTVCFGVQVLMLNANNIKGDLSDPDVLKNLAALERLEILELGNLPGACSAMVPVLP